MHIRKSHILSRHLFNVDDQSAGIFSSEEGGGIDWLWDAIHDIVGLFTNNNQEFRRLGGQTYQTQQRRILLEMPIPEVRRG